VRPIHSAQLDKRRPVVVLTRELVRPYLTRVTVAPITTTVRGLSTELPVTTANGLDGDGVISCDNIVTVPASALGPQIGVLLPDQEEALTAAIHAAFDLD
jgi:mRNA interferase MazF